MTRIRQLVFAGKSKATADRLSHLLGLAEPFRDEGVGHFGLDNAVFALGDQFLEVVWPIADTAPAKRFLDRNGGEGGYMAIFETADIDAARARAAQMKVRCVHDMELDDIRASHFHPSDLGAAIVSVDQPMPAGEWRWGGPDWRGRAAPGRITGATLTARDPVALADRWARLLGDSAQPDGDGARIALEGGDVQVVPGETDGLTGFALAVPDREAALERARKAGYPVDGARVRFAGVDLALSAV